MWCWSVRLVVTFDIYSCSPMTLLTLSCPHKPLKTFVSSLAIIKKPSARPLIQPHTFALSYLGIESNFFFGIKQHFLSCFRNIQINILSLTPSLGSFHVSVPLWLEFMLFTLLKTNSCLPLSHSFSIISSTLPVCKWEAYSYTSQPFSLIQFSVLNSYA